MKNLFLLLAITFLIASCNTKKEEKQREESNSTEKGTSDSHNARNSLDYEGTYQGMYVGDLPTASGSGMIVTVKLSDGKYVKTIQYKDDKTNEVYKSEGDYFWNRDGNKITLEGEEEPNSYFVAEGKLYHLDMDGNRITGELADHYILKKQ